MATKYLDNTGLAYFWGKIKSWVTSRGYITSSGSITGNAGTATKLKTARAISAGDLEFQGSANFDGSGNISLNVTNHRCIVSVSNTNNYPFHRIAYVPLYTGSWNDRGITFLVSKDYQDSGYGIARIIFRTNNVASQEAQCSVQWLCRTSDIAVDAIQVGFVKTAGASYLDVFYHSNGAYNSAVCRVIAHGNTRSGVGRGFTVVSASTEVGSTTATDPKTSVESYKTIADAGTALHNQAYTDIIAASDAGVTGQAEKLSTSRTISLTGDVSGSASFDGSANASITATVADDSHNHVISNVDGLQTALDAKAADSGVVHLAGAEMITGAKTFSSEVNISTANALRMKSSSYGVFFRNDNSHFYLLVTASGDADGTWTTARPLNVDLATGVCNINGNAATATKVVGTAANDTVAELVRGTMGSNDAFRIAIGGGNNAGWAEIATADDYNEPIYVRQYQGGFTTLKRTATLLDGSGNTSFPGTVTANAFSGPLTGNVTGNCSGTAANVTGTVAIDHGGTGATTRLNAVKALTNEKVGSSPNYFLTITTNWAKAGYTSVADAKTALGLKSAAYTESSAYAAASHGTHVTFPSSGTPANIGTASNGTASTVARSDHVHALPDSGVTAQTWGNTSQQTPSHGGTFNIPYFTVSAKGIVTAAGTTTVKLPTDNNTDTKVNVTLGTTTKAYLLGVSTAPTSTAQALTAISDTGVYLDTTAGKLTATTFAGSLSGNASSATEFSANKSVTLTGDVTGTASSKAGWSVATTLANSGVTAGRYTSVNVDAKGRVTAGNVKHSYTTAANAAKNWYRIANASTHQINASTPLHLQFFVRAQASAAGVGYWETWFVDLEVWGQNAGCRVFGNTGAPFSQICVRYENTAASVTSSTAPAVDIYLNYVLAGGAVLEIEEVYNSGWTFVADGTLAVSSVPSGYETRGAIGVRADGVERCTYADYVPYLNRQISNISAAFTLADSYLYRSRTLNCTGTFTITVPSINSGYMWCVIKNKNAASGVITIHPSTTSVLIDNSNADITLQPGEYVCIHSAGANNYSLIADGRWKSNYSYLDNKILLVKGTADNCYAATTAHQLLIESMQDALDSMLKTKIYPVGSTYFSLTDSRNPATILGFGTWAKIEGRFLLGASSSYAADSTGGEATHKLTENEMPKHYHDSLRYKSPTASKFGCNSGTLSDTSWTVPYASGRGQDYYVTGNTGGSQAHNNMPPYLAGYLWRRTA